MLGSFIAGGGSDACVGSCGVEVDAGVAEVSITAGGIADSTSVSMM